MQHAFFLEARNSQMSMYRKNMTEKRQCNQAAGVQLDKTGTPSGKSHSGRKLRVESVVVPNDHCMCEGRKLAPRGAHGRQEEKKSGGLDA